ncbi:MAG: DUF3025 domain-containing protein [Xanthomonadales bacterium]|nr:DUF3025 domain-containing protein [Xanthomonadales bacterium]
MLLPLWQHLPDLPTSWPTLNELNQWLPPGVISGGGQDILFVEQVRSMAALDYERHILETGQIPTRPGCWHDFFNAAMWICFPHSKARLNWIHVSQGSEDQPNRRGPARNAATLLDESGVVVATLHPWMARANADHRWRQLLVEARESWHATALPLLLGHGLAEQCLVPYPGMTARAVYLTVDPALLDLPGPERLAAVDRLLCQRLQSPITPSDFPPLPILGIPGWDPANADPGFYDNIRVFRPGRQPG